MGKSSADFRYKLRPRPVPMTIQSSRFSKAHFIVLCSAATFAVAVAVLIGWLADSPFLRTLSPSPVEMKPNVAVSFILIAIATLVLSIWRDRRESKYLATFCGLAVFLFGSLTLIEWLFGTNFGIDQLVISVEHTAWTGIHPGRMPPHSALALALIGLSIILFLVADSDRIRNLLLTSVRIIAIVALLGMLYGVDQFYGIHGLTHHNSMPVVTGLFLLVTTTALTLTDERSRLARLLLSKGAGGEMARRALPVVLIVPPLTGLLLQACTQMGLFEREFRLTLTISLSMIVMGLIMTRYSKRVDELDESHKTALRELSEKEEQFRDLFNYSQGMICIHGTDGTLINVNPAVLACTGYLRDEIEGKNIREFLPVDQRSGIDAFLRQIENEGLSNGLLPIVAKDGRRLMWRYQSILVSDTGREPYVIGHALDVSQLVAAQAELEALSLTDELTGLYNRRGFLTLAEQQLRLERHPGTARGLTLMFADLDGLKKINDTMGHEAGSEAIATFARIVRSVVRSGDLVGRWGGDEFVILSVGAGADNIQLMSERIEKGIADYNAASGKGYEIACSIGVAPVDLDGDRTFEEIIAEADAAMYEEKKRRKAARGETLNSPAPNQSFIIHDSLAWY